MVCLKDLHREGGIRTQVYSFFFFFNTHRSILTLFSMIQVYREKYHPPQKKADAIFLVPGVLKYKEDLFVSGKCQWGIFKWSKVCPAAFLIGEFLLMCRGKIFRL